MRPSDPLSRASVSPSRRRSAPLALDDRCACLSRFGTLRPVGAMPTIRSDNGLVFTANRFRAACRDYRLTQEFITPYALQQNDRTFLPQPQGGVRLATQLRLVRRGQGCDRELDPLLQRASSPPGARLPEPSPVPGSTTTGGGLRWGEHHTRTMLGVPPRIAMCRAVWLQKGCREAAGEAWYGASEPVTHRHPCSQRAGSAYGIRTRVTAVRGRPEGLSDRDQRGASGHKKSQELWPFAAKIKGRFPRASQRSPSRTEHLGCKMIAAAGASHMMQGMQEEAAERIDAELRAAPAG